MIRLKHIKKTYDRFTTHPNHVLDDVSLEFPNHGFVCILGPSGCGKTTLLNVIGGLDKFDKGQITVADVTAKRYGTKAKPPVWLHFSELLSVNGTFCNSQCVYGASFDEAE